jgi:hypothetical protein
MIATMHQPVFILTLITFYMVTKITNVDFNGLDLSKREKEAVVSCILGTNCLEGDTATLRKISVASNCQGQHIQMWFKEFSLPSCKKWM